MISINSILRIVIFIKSPHNPTASSIPEGMFQVSSVYGYDENEHEADLTERLDPNKSYKSQEDVAKALGFPDSISIDTEYEEF